MLRWTNSVNLQDDISSDSFFNAVETETLALFEHLSFEFPKEFDVFAPAIVVHGTFGYSTSQRLGENAFFD